MSIPKLLHCKIYTGHVYVEEYFRKLRIDSEFCLVEYILTAYALQQFSIKIIHLLLL
jgi:hypothetical protein